MQGWTLIRPEESGYFWVVKKYFEDGDLRYTSDPDVWYIDPNNEYGCCAQLGTDDPVEIPDTEILVDVKYGDDKINRRWEYWLKPIPQVYFDESVDSYPESHQEGIMYVENTFIENTFANG